MKSLRRLIAISVQLLPKYSIKKQVCSKLPSKVFPRIPRLAIALFRVSVRSVWQCIDKWSQYRTWHKTERFFGARVQNTGNLSYIHGTRTLVLSWTYVKSIPGGGLRKRTSKSTLFLSGAGRSPTFLNIEFDDSSILSTYDKNPCSATLMLSQSFPVSTTTLS